MSVLDKEVRNEKNVKTIGVVGLGLIGASLSAALKKAGYTVLGTDKDKTTMDFAAIAGTIDEPLKDESIEACGIIFIAIGLDQAIGWLKEKSKFISPDSLVVDCCGVKKRICEVGRDLSHEYGFSFIGGHPMAGKQVGGYKNSSSELFKDAVFCLVPEDGNDIRLLVKAKNILKDAGFTGFILMSKEEHDKAIAFTSQMAHLVSNAYIKSDMAEVGSGAALTGGAFRDMTRVAYLDEDMWTELFMENRENLLCELKGFMDELERYRNAIEKGDEEALSLLLKEGKERKRALEENAQ